MTRPLMTTHVEKARAAWGDELPAWVMAMAEECDGSSQGIVAERMKYSPATVSQTIGNKYAGKVEAIREAFASAYSGLTITCPAKGEMTAQVCRQWRDKARAWARSNPERNRMYRACRRCPRFSATSEGGAS